MKTQKIFIALIILGLSAPLFKSVIYPVFLMNVLCFALFAAAFNLLLGFAGLLSFGHAAFFGFAAYVTGYLVRIVGVTPELGIAAGTVVAGIMGLAFGSLAIRRQGIYFAMITLAFAQMVFFLCVQMKFTGGEDGIQGIPRGKFLGLVDLTSNVSMYYFVLIVVTICFWFIYRVVHSPFGQVLKSIRENEARAISLGYDADKFKLVAFVLSAAFAGTAGATKCLVNQLASLTDVHWHMSGEVVLTTLLGGLGTFVGPLVGAFTVKGLEHFLAETGSWVPVITGAIFVICVLIFRRGIVGEIAAIFRKMVHENPRSN